MEIPKIPNILFYYIQDSNIYQNIYDLRFDSCHSIGLDVVFQYSPTIDVVGLIFSVEHCVFNLMNIRVLFFASQFFIYMGNGQD
jgi:hypothetical protein